ncbi:MGMT family protein [Streptacidiphilus sp. PB12-B1b]|nr:MGMT family protein [Streptacidiphilus sp. PB12-B1b]QMU75221.1 MGMT family protein [Streptacidiphilus sp. PB12-B1b]
MPRVSADEIPGSLPPFAELVLELTERIPAGRVMTYGDVAEYLAGEEGEAVPPGKGAGRRVGGPRQVGRVMALYGGSVPWWRVVRADGALLPGHELRALEQYRAEGTPLRTVRGRGPARSSAAAEDLPRVDLARARWDGR